MTDPIRLKKYIKERKVVMLLDILNHFRVEKSVVEPMLDLWIRKGKLIRKTRDRSCKGCGKCDRATVEFYEWLEEN